MKNLFGVEITADEVIAAQAITDPQEAAYVRRSFGHDECPVESDPCWCDTCLSYGDGEPL